VSLTSSGVGYLLCDGDALYFGLLRLYRDDNRMHRRLKRMREDQRRLEEELKQKARMGWKKIQVATKISAAVREPSSLRGDKGIFAAALGVKDEPVVSKLLSGARYG
jgi:hypothetical protein